MKSKTTMNSATATGRASSSTARNGISQSVHAGPDSAEGTIQCANDATFHSMNRNNVMFLQRTLGNRAVAQFFQMKTTIHNVLQQQQITEEESIQVKSALQDCPVCEKEQKQTIHRKTGQNQTGMPDNLKCGIENLSGIDMSDVHVHGNSDKPAKIGALAYTQGTDIYVAPQQQKHLAHEAWHAVQQKQGRVQPTVQTKGVAVNDDEALESEADIKGQEALTAGHMHPSGMGILENSVHGTVATHQRHSFTRSNIVQRSPISDELSQLWRDRGKGAFYNRLRQVSPLSDPDFVDFIHTLSGDDLWLTTNIVTYGIEANWPIHLRIEREMKGWADCGGKGAVFDILRTANGAEAGNAQLAASLLRVFAGQPDDLWLGRHLQRYGMETAWPIHLRVEREMKGWADCGGKGAVFDILRTANGAEAGNAELTATLNALFAVGSDDIWLAANLQAHGPETAWPIHLRVEREMKGWGDCGGKGAVFDILRTANGAEAANADLTNSINSVFAQGTQDRWLAHVLQALGPETAWPGYLTVLWTDIQTGTMPVPTMEVSGAELIFEDIVLPNQTAYNCYEYAMGGTTNFRQPGGGVAPANRTVSGVLALMTADMGSAPVNCDAACGSGTRKIMAVVTDDADPANPNFVSVDNEPTRIIYWLWDFHFFRQDIGGLWSQKSGGTRHRMTDEGGARISDPRSANRRSLSATTQILFGKTVWRGLDYRNIVGCWCVPPGTR